MSNIIRMPIPAPAQTLNVMLTGKQLMLNIAGMRCTLALYKQLPQASVIDKHGNLNGIVHGVINYHLRAECGLAEPDTHIHVIWTTDNEIYRDQIWVTNITINRNYHLFAPTNWSQQAREEYIQTIKTDPKFYNWAYQNKHTPKGRKFSKLSEHQQISIIEKYNGLKFEDWYRKNFSEKFAEDQRNIKAYSTYKQKWADTVQALRDLPQLIIGS